MWLKNNGWQILGGRGCLITKWGREIQNKKREREREREKKEKGREKREKKGLDVKVFSF